MVRQGFFVALAVATFASATVADDWLQFRGRGSRGSASGAEDRDGVLPVEWDETHNIAWNVALPGRGLSSPIVVGDQVVVTANSGPDRHRLHVLCFAVATGNLEWERQFFATGRTRCHPATSMAAPTPVSDGEAIYVLFATNDLFCFDLEGNLRWLRALNQDYPAASQSVGMASSPVIGDGVLVLQLENDSDSIALGIDTETGANVWKIPRPKGVSWSSPCVMESVGGEPATVVLQSGSGFHVYKLRDGLELSTGAQNCDRIVSPTTADGVVYVPSEGIRAVRPVHGGTPEIVWYNERLRASTPSPVVYRDHIYTYAAPALRCAKLSDGKVAWQLRVDGKFSSTPVAAGGHLYFFDETGTCHVVKIPETGDETAEIRCANKLGEKIFCTPAVAGGALYVRSDQTLWKIAK